MDPEGAASTRLARVVVTLEPVTLTVQAISAEEHLAAIDKRPSVSFLQTPAWGVVKDGWASESVGWFDGADPGGDLVGIGHILYRKAPRIRRYLAYLPEGPDLPWARAAASGELGNWLSPLIEHVRSRGAFGIRMGPPIVTRRWFASTLKAGLADPAVSSLDSVVADEVTEEGQQVADALAALGWRPPQEDSGFSAGQPRQVFQVPLAGKTEEEVLAGFNQQWRRNVKKADKAGVEVVTGTESDLAAFHELYTETARRDGFTPRPLEYFSGMWEAMTAESDDRLCLYLAYHEGQLVAATTMVRVGLHAWYSYGASSTERREVRGSNAIQWRMMRDALTAGAAVYDLRGITDTLEEGDPHVGLLRFKLGTGGFATEYLGEWDLPISRILHTAFDLYMKRRG